MKGLFISSKGIKGGANLTENYTSNVLYQSMDENTNKFANQEIAKLISEFDKKKELVSDYLDFNLVFCGTFEEIQNNISFEEFIRSNSERIVAIFKSVKSSDTKSFIVGFIQTETDYKYGYVYLKLSKLFEIFNSYGIEYKVDPTPKVQQHGIYSDETSTRILINYSPVKKHSKLREACEQCPEIQLVPNGKAYQVSDETTHVDKFVESFMGKKQRKLTQEQIDEIHARGKITAEEMVEEWESLGLCAPGDAIGSAKERCLKFNNCHECLVDYTSDKEAYEPIDLKVCNAMDTFMEKLNGNEIEQVPVKKLVPNNKK